MVTALVVGGGRGFGGGGFGGRGFGGHALWSVAPGALPSDLVVALLLAVLGVAGPLLGLVVALLLAVLAVAEPLLGLAAVLL